MLRDAVVVYVKEGYNCAESIIRAANDYYHLGLHDADMRMTAAFGGGFQIGDICGGLSGAACVISAKYVQSKAHDQQKEIRSITQKLVLAFQKRMGARICAKIKPVFHDQEQKCLKTIQTSCDVLEEVIDDWEHQN